MKHFLKTILGKLSPTLALALALGLAPSTALHAASAQRVLSGKVHDALFAVAFDGKRGLAAGAAGSLLETTDGGQTWAPITGVPTRLALFGVAVHGDQALAVGQQGLILRREGGAWKQIESGSSERLLSVSINAGGAAVAVGAFGTVLSSTDGGKSWQSTPPIWDQFAEAGTAPHLYASAIDDQGTITIAGEFSLILRRVAGSTDWQALNKGEASLFALHLGRNGIGYAVGQNGTVLRSDSNGANWTAVDAGTTAILLGVHASPEGKVLISGMRDMRASTDNGQTWKTVTGGGTNALWYQGLAQPDDSGAMLAVGQAGNILRIDD